MCYRRLGGRRSDSPPRPLHRTVWAHTALPPQQIGLGPRRRRGARVNPKTQRKTRDDLLKRRAVGRESGPAVTHHGHEPRLGRRLRGGHLWPPPRQQEVVECGEHRRGRGAPHEFVLPGCPARRELPEEDRERVDIGRASAVLLPTEHLGRHPRQRLQRFGHAFRVLGDRFAAGGHDPPDLLLHHKVHPVVRHNVLERLGGGREHKVGTLRMQLSGEAKVADHSATVGVKQHVVRLEISVNQRNVVEVRHPRSNLHGNGEADPPLEYFFGVPNRRVQRALLHELRNNKPTPARSHPAPKKLEEVGVVNAVEGAAIVRKVGLRRQVHQIPPVRQHLDRDGG
eukprot:m.455289 g.455289  ORF g.455289 m.455289 type:complete len:340 (-) comp20842_c0_seq1:2487-3506(-)